MKLSDPSGNIRGIKMTRPAQRKHRPPQLGLALRERPRWGGKREGAGRKPKGAKAMMPHEPRPKVLARHPLHVTLKLRPEMRSLRNKEMMKIIRRAFCASCSRQGFRITDWSVQRDHIHLVVESNDHRALARGMQSLTIRVAKGLNKRMGRGGAVFVDRFHARALRTPREVRNCLVYVLLNARHHGIDVPKGRPDPCSSWMHFDGWRTPPQPSPQETGPPCAAPPRSWLRQVGWRRHGLVSYDEVPGGCHSKARSSARTRR